jgi:hypothetical protein
MLELDRPLAARERVVGILILCNRVMWGLLAVLVVAYLAGHAWLVHMAQDDDPAAPIPVPQAAVGTAPQPSARVIPKPELFALVKKPGSKVAKAPVAPTKAVRLPRADSVQGIIRFDNFAGAFTNKGFVPEGADFEGARVKTIAPDGVDFLLGPNSEMHLPLEASKGVTLPAMGELRVTKLE